MLPRPAAIAVAMESLRDLRRSMDFMDVTWPPCE